MRIWIWVLGKNPDPDQIWRLIQFGAGSSFELNFSDSAYLWPMNINCTTFIKKLHGHPNLRCFLIEVPWQINEQVPSSFAPLLVCSNTRTFISSFYDISRFHRRRRREQGGTCLLIPQHLEVIRADLEHILANLEIFGQTWKWIPISEDLFVEITITLILWEKRVTF